jgi:hypothetical protein
MSLLQRLAGRVRSASQGRVVDPNALNWLYITYNTVEEAIRVTRQGKIRPAAMSRYRWRDKARLRSRSTTASGSPTAVGWTRCQAPGLMDSTKPRRTKHAGSSNLRGNDTMIVVACA